MSKRTAERVYPQQLRDAEAEVQLGTEVSSKRQSESRAAPSDGVPLAVALSGGGIRSATLSLGFFQGLARHGGVLDRMTLLSTVSGGSYFGSFLTALWRRDDINGASDVEAVLTERPGPFADAKITPVRWLRENSRFLAPQGGGDMLLAIASTIRNMLAVLVVWLLPLFAALLVVVAAQGYLQHAQWLPVAWRQVFQVNPDGLGGWAPFALIGTFTILLPLGGLYWALPSTRQRSTGRGWRRFGRTLLVTLMTVALGMGVLGNALSDELLSSTSHGSLLLALAAASLVVVRVLTPNFPSGDGKRPLYYLGAGLSLAFGLGLLRLIDAHHLLRLWDVLPTDAPSFARLGVVLAANIGVLAFLTAAALLNVQSDADAGEARATGVAVAQHHLNIQFTNVFVLVAALVVAAVIDTLGLALALAMMESTTTLSIGIGSLLALLSSLAAGGERVLSALKSLLGERFALPASAIIGLLALALWAAILIGLSALVYTIVLEPTTGATQVGLPVYSVAHWMGAAIAGLAALVIALVIGVQASFANYSSLHMLYRARLARAYIGASNPNRLGIPATQSAGASGTAAVKPIQRDVVPATELVPGDDLPIISRLKPGQPLHLINVTINETVDTRMGTQSQDRKGVHMAVSPIGISVSTRHSALFADTSAGSEPTVYLKPVNERDGEFHALVGKKASENATLATWTAISGAAASTGMGGRTSVALSMLMGLLNIRLGYWWNSGTDGSGGLKERPPSVSRARQLLVRWQPLYAQLIDELLARFRGTCQQYWNLSDGGHFENLGVYELLRRQPPLIIALDNGEDADSAFEDVANLIRKARLDFAASIEFLDLKAATSLLLRTAHPGRMDPPSEAECAEILASGIGTLAHLGRTARGEGQPVRSEACAALAWITYSDGTRSLMLYVKSAFYTPDAAPDLMNYLRAHPAFPHEPTADQFFDEAQWESYRRLGEINATALCGLKLGGHALFSLLCRAVQ